MDKSTEQQAPPTKTGLFARLLGFALIAEALLCAAFSIPFFGAGVASITWVGVVFAAGGALLGWAGLVLAGLRPGNPRAAAMTVLVCGLPLAFITFGVLLVGACAGGLNCPMTLPVTVHAIPIAAAAFNVLCAIVLWRQGAARHPPSQP